MWTNNLSSWELLGCSGDPVTWRFPRLPSGRMAVEAANLASSAAAEVAMFSFVITTSRLSNPEWRSLS